VKAVLEFLGLLLRVSGLCFLIREVICRNRCAIVLYHDPDPEVFERHIEYLTRHYSVIPFSSLVYSIYERDWSRMPPKSLVIHIDDGYARNYELLDAIRRFRIRPTLYLCSHIADSNRQFWSRLKNGESKRLRLVKNSRLLEKLRSEASFTPELETRQRQALSRTEILAMASDVDFQSHGRYHFSLLTLDDEELTKDLFDSKARIEALKGQWSDHFSFPHGDYGKREIDQVRECGYRTARTTEPGWNTMRTDPYRLRIVADVPGSASVNELCAHLTGIPRLLKRLAYRRLTRHLHAWRQEYLMRRRFF
jgi:peptidoglycan/xylan/chitin deacetylase (PgdA/CDA1 family)